MRSGSKPAFAIVDQAWWLPGNLSWEELLAGRSAVYELPFESPVAMGAPALDPPDPPSTWHYSEWPRALAFAYAVLTQLKLDPERRYGLVCGLPNLYAEVGYLESALAHRHEQAALEPTLPFSLDIPLNFLAGMVPGEGPRLRLDAACATGNDALITAHQWLETGFVDDVVVVAAAASLNPVGLGLFHQLKALNPARRAYASCPFDARRRGFVMGEGAAAVWLSADEKLPSQGYLCGYGQSMNATHFVDVPEDISAMARACSEAMGTVAQVAYVNAHGTATKMNDLRETQLYRAVFGSRADQLAISSTKSMLGHCLGAASLIEALICLAALRDQMAPPTINLECPDPECDLNYVPMHAIPIRGNFALSPAFAFGGHNSCVLLAGEKP